MTYVVDLDLWHSVQRIVYPRRFPSNGHPFPADVCSPCRKRASWLYWTLLGDPGLRARFFA